MLCTHEFVYVTGHLLADGDKPIGVRLLAAGIMPHGPKGVKMVERWNAAYRGDRRAPWDSSQPDGSLTHKLTYSRTHTHPTHDQQLAYGVRSRLEGGDYNGDGMLDLI